MAGPRRFLCPNQFVLARRNVSTSVTFTAIDKLPSTPFGSQTYSNFGKLRVQLLKSPSHLGHATLRMNRLYNEDRYTAHVLTLKEKGESRVGLETKKDDSTGEEVPKKRKRRTKKEMEEAKDQKNSSGRDTTVSTKNCTTQSDSRVSTSTLDVDDARKSSQNAAKPPKSYSSGSNSASSTGEPVVFNFSIFDGHGGEQCLQYLSENLPSEVESAGLLCDPIDTKAREQLVKKYWKNIGGYWKRWYKHRQAHFDKYFGNQGLQLSKLPAASGDLFARIPLAYLQTDYDFFELPDNASGLTATSVFIETLYLEPEKNLPVKENYYFNRQLILRLTVAQVGDTKCILVDKNGEAHALTELHHPLNPEEASRLRKYAASYFMTDLFGEERFVLFANTRAFGDLSFKEMGITAEPDVRQLVVGDSGCIAAHLTPEEIQQHTWGGLGGDEAFLILCTDGVHDVITDQEIADIVMVHVNMKGHADPQLCAEEVIKFVEYVGGDDNATVMVIRLNGWKKWPIMDRTGLLRQERLNDNSNVRARAR